jgi:hypothetical protein
VEGVFWLSNIWSDLVENLENGVEIFRRLFGQ